MDEDVAKGDRRGRSSTGREDPGAVRSLDEARTWTAALDRCHLAARRYLRDALGNPTEAEELFRQFAPTLLRTGLADADPSSGRSRDRLRTTLIRFVSSHRRVGRSAPHLPLLGDAASEEGVESERFDAIWREVLLERAWRRLEAHEAGTGQPFHTILRCRVDIPGLSSPELADRIGRELGRTMSTDGTRQALNRARAEFARLLLDEVVATLPAGAPFQAIEQELIATGLLAFCREAVDRVRPARGRVRGR